VPLGELLAVKVALAREGARVRLEQRPKNLKALLERAASDGYTSFATVARGATVSSLEFKPLS
jgi:histidyl-tRNA synthetase